MPEKIDKTLMKLAGGMPNGTPTTNKPVKKSGTSKPDSPRENASAPESSKYRDLPGDPNCPICAGIGFVRIDVPIGDPRFGKAEVCTCRAGEISQQVRQKLYTLSNLAELAGMTFENFDPQGRGGLWPKEQESLEIAYSQAQQYSRSLKGWLVLQGGTGCGKTHLAAAIGNFVVDLGVPTLFITAPDLLDSLRYAYGDPVSSFEERFEQILTAPLLILDDFGTQNATAWAQEKLFQVLNTRYVNRLPLVVTTNLSLVDLEERIRSRIEDPDYVTRVRILAPDFRKPIKDIGHHELSSLHLLHKCTFETFELRNDEGLKADELKSLEKAYQAAIKYAENPKGWLLFSGAFGCGKTHLAAAIANRRAAIALPPLFVSVPDLLDHLRATFSPSSSVTLDRRFDMVRETPLLILDDLGVQSTTPWVREKLYQLFNYRYNAELPTVITTSAAKDEMDKRLLSRMEDSRLCTMYGITVPAYRGTVPVKRRPTTRK